MLRVSFIGKGNVGTRMAKRLQEVGCEIVQVCSRTETPVSELNPSACDLVVVAVSDDAIKPLLDSVETVGTALWVHTSGSIGLDAFNPAKFPRCGVLYPLQTLLKNREVDWAQVPMLVEGDPQVEQIARMMSPSVATLDSESRRRLHAAAVICNNMTTYLWSLSQRIMTDAGLDFAMLEPLLRMTLERSTALSPENALTGPARRGDIQTIAKHIAALPPDIAETYRFLSIQMLNRFHPEINHDSL